MKAIRVVGYHKDLEQADVEEPKISGPLDVIVKIGAAGVCRTDIHILEGTSSGLVEGLMRVLERHLSISVTSIRFCCG